VNDSASHRFHIPAQRTEAGEDFAPDRVGRGLTRQYFRTIGPLTARPGMGARWNREAL